ncbi:MAG: competence/damage-inducible protein A [Chloroflexi bacterium]|nr:competence/damage-inducible protein A [Chloroflexota bacterium]
MPSVEIIAIGSELLLGLVQDTNSHWLSKQIAGLGGELRRVAIVGDVPEAIGAELRGALQRRPDLLITSGGLGPTADDLTLSAVAQALELPLELDPRALEVVRSRYAALHRQGYLADPHLSEARRKMAYFPRGGEPIHNPVGTAPACLLRVESSTLICLPGVPGELKGIWTESLQPILREIFGAGAYLEVTLRVDCPDESLLAPLLTPLVERHPDVYIKSRAKVFAERMQLQITLSARGGERSQVQSRIESALGEVRRALEAARLRAELEEG